LPARASVRPRSSLLTGQVLFTGHNSFTVIAALKARVDEAVE
jgi:hypothetical protein